MAALQAHPTAVMSALDFGPGLRVRATKSSRWSADKPFLAQFGEGTAIALSSRLGP